MVAGRLIRVSGESSTCAARASVADPERAMRAAPSWRTDSRGLKPSAGLAVPPADLPPQPLQQVATAMVELGGWFKEEFWTGAGTDGRINTKLITKQLESYLPADPAGVLLEDGLLRGWNVETRDSLVLALSRIKLSCIRRWVTAPRAKFEARAERQPHPARTGPRRCVCLRTVRLDRGRHGVHHRSGRWQPGVSETGRFGCALSGSRGRRRCGGSGGRG